MGIRFENNQISFFFFGVQNENFIIGGSNPIENFMYVQLELSLLKGDKLARFFIYDKQFQLVNFCLFVII